MFTLAHISDPHLGPLPPVKASDLLNKRFFGYLSWIRRRRRLHRPEVLAALARDLESLAPDHLVVTGDLTNIALEAEFPLVADWLQGLGLPQNISVIPGNHDAYVEVPWAASWACWLPFMSGDDAADGPDGATGEDHFPFVRFRGPAAIVGLSSAQPTPLFCAHGTLGAGQLARLDSLLRRLGEEGWFRVILLHHAPVLKGVNWRKRLVDAVAFREVVTGAGAELVLHGHDHTFGVDRIDAPSGDVPVLGVPSASAGSDGKKPVAHYHLYRIAREGNAWRIGVEARGFNPAEGHFGPSRSYRL
jgi:3',5'-cyclic AMP phosphodiesterase CpdA